MMQFNLCLGPFSHQVSRLLPPLFCTCISLVAAWGFAVEPSTKAAGPERTQPNIILIMADDVSWEAFGCYGADDYQTPRIDAIAKQGLQFNHCYSTPICTTSRVKLMTGQYNFRNYTHFGYLNPDQKTFAHLLKGAGYKTAIAGKWQLNGLTNELPGYESNRRPYDAGFDEYMLWQLTKPKSVQQGGGERFWSPIFEHNGMLLGIEDNANRYGPDMLCDFVCDFIQRNQEGPFFVYYPMVLVHDPFVPTPDTIGDADRGHAANKSRAKDKKQNFVAMVAYMDKIVGRIFDQVAAVGQLENTIILFTADNGTNVAITSSWRGQAIQGGKGGMTDMGTHVPLVAYWKNHTPAGKQVDSLVEFTDFYPTLAEAAGVALGAGDPIDGLSFYHHLIGTSGKERNWVLCHYQPYWNKTPGQFVRNQAYKLYRDGRFFDIGSGDLKEAHDLADNNLGEAGAVARKSLTAIIKRAPPAPQSHGDKDTVERPIYPDWQRILEPND